MDEGIIFSRGNHIFYGSSHDSNEPGAAAIRVPVESNVRK